MPYRQASHAVLPRRIALDSAPPPRPLWILTAVVALLLVARTQPLLGLILATVGAIAAHHRTRGRQLVVTRTAVELRAGSWLGWRAVGVMDMGPGGLVVQAVARDSAGDDLDAVLVGDAGRLAWRVGSPAQFAAMRERVDRDLAGAGALAADPGSASLRGGIRERRSAQRIELDWRPSSHRFVPTPTLAAVAALVVSAATTLARISGSRVFGSVLLVAWLPWLLWRSAARERRTRIALAGGRLRVDAPGASADLRLPVQPSVFRDRRPHSVLHPAQRGLALDDGVVSVTVGGRLTDPELRWLAERIEQVQSAQLGAAADDPPSRP